MRPCYKVTVDIRNFNLYIEFGTEKSTYILSTRTNRFIKRWDSYTQRHAIMAGFAKGC